MAVEKTKSILVVGGGISGITTAVEAAEVGYEVTLIEKNPYLGGRVNQLNKYFPKLCPPNCGLEINFRRIKNNPRVKFYTMAEVEKISGTEGDFDVTIRLEPRFVNENCTACNACVEACLIERPNEFNFGMDKTKAIYLPHDFSFPLRYVIDEKYCTKEKCNKCVEVCTYNAIDLNMKPQSLSLKVGSIVWATGWNPYDATKIDNLGFGTYQNVITNMMMERLASQNGPTKGKILRPSDGKEPSRIAFVQCAGSRDENHLPYCSYVCCLASMKQATYIREQYPEAEIFVFYIDIRAPARAERVYMKALKDEKIKFIKGKVAKIEEDPTTRDLTVTAEDALTLQKIHEKADMVVLATGMAPITRESKIPAGVSYDTDGFILLNTGVAGMYAAGCSLKPIDVYSSVQTATAAALKAIQSASGGVRR
ncbi:MAG: CoB--CoM heterodisulfide reductase iron-sulfur subunit A family protein [Thermodesulfovibrionales bacterium]|nr:CoB--CoM heterodisulfide reductase iron-sulfur subunit A family protein [Thermodesulfovibrionales bacterium]